MKLELIQDILLGSSAGYLYDSFIDDNIKSRYNASAPSQIKANVISDIFATNCIQIAIAVLIVSENPLIKQTTRFIGLPIGTIAALSIWALGKLSIELIVNNLDFCERHILPITETIGNFSRAILITSLFTSALLTSSVKELSFGLSLIAGYLSKKFGSPVVRSYVDMTRATMAVITVISFLSTGNAPRASQYSQIANGGNGFI